MVDAVQKPKMKFRNYQPYDKNLTKKARTDEPTPAAIEAAAVPVPASTVVEDSNAIEMDVEPVVEAVVAAVTTHQQQQLQQQQQQSIQQSQQIEEEEKSLIKRELRQFMNDAGEQVNIVPKKANWDLKNQVEGRLEKLQRRTQRAIVDMLRQKMSEMDENGDDSESDMD
jgi:hypothetical protein